MRANGDHLATSSETLTLAATAVHPRPTNATRVFGRARGSPEETAKLFVSFLGFWIPGELQASIPTRRVLKEDKERERTMSSGRDRAQKACNAAKALGIPTSTSKPVLKKLLRVYENNWEYIEADNYQVFVDAIFDMEETQDGDPGDQLTVDDTSVAKNDMEGSRDCHSYGTRVRARQVEEQLLSSELSSESFLKRPKLEQEDSPDIQYQHKRNELSSSSRNSRSMIRPTEPHPSIKEKSPAGFYPSERAGEVATNMNNVSSNPILNIHPLQAEPAQPLSRRKGKEPIDETSGNSTFREPIVEPGTSMVNSFSGRARSVATDDSSLTFETPLAMICPTEPFPVGDRADDGYMNQGHTLKISSAFKENENRNPVLHFKEKMNGEKGPQDDACTKKTSQIVADHNPTSIVDIASSESGEIKLSFSCSTDRTGFHMPDIEEVFKRVEDRCLKSYKILQPDFKLGNLMRELCQSFFELGAEPPEDNQENTVDVFSALESLNRSDMHDYFGRIPAYPSDSTQLAGPERSGIIIRSDHSSRQKVFETNVNSKPKKNKEPSKNMSGNIMVVQKPQFTLSESKPIHDVNDISKGEERVRISIANQISSEKYPPFFNYIPHNIVYQNAYINVSLARIGDDDYCADCYNDCLAAPIPCACARETGGEFAYTSDGVIRKELLNEYISMNYEPQKDRLFYCKECPLERFNNDGTTTTCKGHAIRKFIKECWSKCGCSKQCGNRVVQRGITYNLQVFYTPEGKGWGLRTLDELPRGAFVCEYVGEVLTNTELYERTIQVTGKASHSYPVLLDADWGSECSMKDEEALCLDATFYGNVARFINHRCFDANLIEIPVEVETPDRHYYHLAFFTTRKVEPLEELTWDYRIDFDDHGHPIKAFKCRCGSQVCRDIKRAKKRSRSKSLASK